MSDNILTILINKQVDDLINESYCNFSHITSILDELNLDEKHRDLLTNLVYTLYMQVEYQGIDRVIGVKELISLIKRRFGVI